MANFTIRVIRPCYLRARAGRYRRVSGISLLGTILLLPAGLLIGRSTPALLLAIAIAVVDVDGAPWYLFGYLYMRLKVGRERRRT